MDSLRFINQIIVNKGQTVSCIYKLVQGCASIVNNEQKQVCRLSAPCYLNVIECIYGVSLTKTVKANGKCTVKKIRMRQSHNLILKQFKEKGIRKSKFKLFEEIHSSKFYELVRLSETITLRKDNQFKGKQSYYYLGVMGNMVVFDKQQNIKIVKLSEGQIIYCFNSDTHFMAESEQVKLLEIHSLIVYEILSEQRLKLIQLSKNQKMTIQNFRSRSKFISHQIKRNYQRVTSKISIPRHFTNSIEFRLNSYQKLCRAKSCFLQKSFPKKTKKEIVSDIKEQNQHNFKVLMELNRRKYGREYIYKKRMQISEKVYSLSCTNTPPAMSQLSQKKTIRLQDVAQGLYENASMKQHFGIIKNHPEIEKDKYLRLKNKQKTNLYKRAKVADRPKNTFPLERDKENVEQIKWKFC